MIDRSKTLGSPLSYAGNCGSLYESHASPTHEADILSAPAPGPPVAETTLAGDGARCLDMSRVWGFRSGVTGAIIPCTWQAKHRGKYPRGRW